MAVLWRNSPAIIEDAEEQEEQPAGRRSGEHVAVIPSLLSSNGAVVRRRCIVERDADGDEGQRGGDVRPERAGRAELQQLRVDQVFHRDAPSEVGELEEHLLEVEVLRRHLVDDRADAGRGQTDGLGGGLKGDERIGGDELGSDALSEQRAAQRLGLRRSHPHTGSRPVGQLGERGLGDESARWR